MAFRLGVDVGGTFTDLFLVNDEDDRQFRVKTPSTPADPSLGVLTGVKRICAEAGIEPSELRNIVHGTIAGNGVVPKLMGTPGGVRQGARWTVGADNDDVLGELGLSAAEIADLKETGIA